MKRVELFVGIFVVVGIAAMAYISIKLGDVRVFGESGYVLYAEFDSVSGLREGADVEIAGVVIGRVEKIELKDYISTVKLRIAPDVRIPEDSTASIRTRGVIGDKFIEITPGGSDVFLKPGETIVDTESSINIEELIRKYIFGLQKGAGKVETPGE